VAGGLGRTTQKLDTEHHPKRNEKAHRRSTFGILIQTNIRPITDEHSMALARRLERVVLAIFHSTDYMSKFIDFNIPGHDIHHVLGIITNYTVERGQHAMGGSVHSHVIMRLLHHSNIGLNVDALRKLIIELWNDMLKIAHMPWESDIKNVMVNIRFLKHPKDYEDYVNKELDSADPDRAWLREIEAAEGEARASGLLKEFIAST